MKSIKCAFHPKDCIVNFCRNQQCLLPLCPNCVKIHSQEHTRNNTYGHYENITSVYSEVEFNLQCVLKNLMNSAEDLKELYEEKHNKRNLVSMKIKQMKVKMMNAIEKYIDDLEKQMVSNIGGIETNIEQDFNLLNENIQAMTIQVEKEMSLINSEKVLKEMITHLSNDAFGKYQERLYTIQQKINDIESKDLICKEFRVNQISEVLVSIHDCYKNIFVGTVRSGHKIKRPSIRSSKVSVTSSQQTS